MKEKMPQGYRWESVWKKVLALKPGKANSIHSGEAATEVYQAIRARLKTAKIEATVRKRGSHVWVEMATRKKKKKEASS